MQIIHCARGRITTTFGEDIGRGFPHRGIDLGHGDATVDDLRIVAPADGTVIAAGPDGTYGNRVIIDHGGGWTSLIAHLSTYNVSVGDQVLQGEAIAVMGNTGTVYVHAHQELRLNGAWQDPELYATTTTTAGDTAEGDDDMSAADVNDHIDQKVKELVANEFTSILRKLDELQAVIQPDGGTVSLPEAVNGAAQASYATLNNSRAIAKALKVEGIE